MSIMGFLDVLSNVKKTGAHSWVATCPAHNDRTPSLVIREKPDGFILCHCFAGCGIDEICEAAKIEIDVLFPDKPEGYSQPLRRAFSASDVLEAVVFEATLVTVAASAMAKGEVLTQAERERLVLAAQRLEEARRLTNG